MVDVGSWRWNRSDGKVLDHPGAPGRQTGGEGPSPFGRNRPRRARVPAGAPDLRPAWPRDAAGRSAAVRGRRWRRRVSSTRWVSDSVGRDRTVADLRQQPPPFRGAPAGRAWAPIPWVARRAGLRDCGWQSGGMRWIDRLGRAAGRMDVTNAYWRSAAAATGPSASPPWSAGDRSSSRPEIGQVLLAQAHWHRLHPRASCCTPEGGAGIAGRCASPTNPTSTRSWRGAGGRDARRVVVVVAALCARPSSKRRGSPLAVAVPLR